MMSGLVHCLYSGYRRTGCGVQLSCSLLEDGPVMVVLAAASDLFPRCAALH